jgi:hypothetical protein
MPYRIAGIDVHKKMLAVVVTDVEIDSEYQFERRRFGSNPEQLRWLAAWLLEQESEEVVMESTAQYWKPEWEALERYWKPLCEKREGARRKSGTLHFGAGTIQSGTTGTQEGFSRCRTPGEATGGPGIDFELCARCRATSVADGDAQEVPVKVRSNTAAEPIGVSSRRSAYQVVQSRLRSAGPQCPADAAGDHRR